MGLCVDRVGCRVLTWMRMKRIMPVPVPSWQRVSQRARPTLRERLSLSLSQSALLNRVTFVRVLMLLTRTLRVSTRTPTFLPTLSLQSTAPLPPRFHRLSGHQLRNSRFLATYATPSLFPQHHATMTYLTPPTPPPSWAYTPSLVTSTIADSIARTQALLAAIVALPKQDRTFDSVFRALAFRDGEESQECEPAVFLQYVSTEELVRDASVEGDKALQVSSSACTCLVMSCRSCPYSQM